LAKFLKIESAHFLAFSLGGVIALQLAIKSPTLVRSLILRGVNFRADSKFVAKIIEEHERIESDSSSRGLRRMHSEAYGERQFFDLSKNLKNEALRRTSLTAEELSKVKCPTLICQGDRDEFVSLEQAIELYRAIENSQLLIIPNYGHVDLGNSECFNHVVLEFLQSQTKKH